LPDTPATRQLAWWVAMLGAEGADVTPVDLARYMPALQERLAPLFDPATMAAAWARDAGRFGKPAELTVEASEPLKIVAVMKTDKERTWSLTFEVEPGPPHRIASFAVSRVNEFKLEVREAGPDDALVLADIERRCPMVLGDTSVWFDRGAEYLASTRLMEDCTIGLASVDGIPAAVSCGAERVVRVGGELKQLALVSHLRVLPEHQRKGLWGAANSVLRKHFERCDGSQAYIAVDNLGMQHGFTGTPDKWPQIVQRVLLGCAAQAGPPAGRAATPADTGEIVRRLNAFHDAEELFVPYTAESFAARMQRAPDLYSWDRVWMTDGALVGVWPAGAALKSVTETNGVQSISVPAVVLDYAFEPGAEAELEALLRAWCGALAPQGIDTLVIYTSPASLGAALLARLARETGEFFTWTPGVKVPAGAAERGLYTDAAYF
jgi:hypothetical protein